MRIECHHENLKFESKLNVLGSNDPAIASNWLKFLVFSPKCHFVKGGHRSRNTIRATQVMPTSVYRGTAEKYREKGLSVQIQRNYFLNLKSLEINPRSLNRRSWNTQDSIGSRHSIQSHCLVHLRIQEMPHHYALLIPGMSRHPRWYSLHQPLPRTCLGHFDQPHTTYHMNFPQADKLTKLKKHSFMASSETRCNRLLEFYIWDALLYVNLCIHTMILAQLVE